MLVISLSGIPLFAESSQQTRKEISKTEEQVEKESAKVNELQKTIDSLDENIKNNEKTIKNLVKQKEVLQKNIYQLQKEISSLDEKNSDLLLTLQKYNNEGKNILLLSSGNLENYNTINELISSAKNDLKNYVQKQKELEQQKEEIDINIQQTKKLEQKNKNQKKELKSEKEESQERVDHLNKQVADLKKQQVIELQYEDEKAFISSSKNGSNETKTELMKNAGIKSSDYHYVDYIITAESNWNYTATNPYSKAYGLCQALPPEKMAVSGSDWKTNPDTQMDWCNGYANSRYGSWENAYNFHKANGWW